jgi:hypothetical protein
VQVHTPHGWQPFDYHSLLERVSADRSSITGLTGWIDPKWAAALWRSIGEAYPYFRGHFEYRAKVCDVASELMASKINKSTAADMARAAGITLPGVPPAIPKPTTNEQEKKTP